MDKETNQMGDKLAEEDQRTLPYHLVRRIVTLTAVFGLLAGLAGSYIFVRYLPGVIPTSKQAVVLQQTSATIDTVKKVSPSVVSITSESTARSIFVGATTTQAAGTGIIVGSDGLIMTNNHVVQDASALSVFTNDGKEYKNAKVVARDPQNDLAFVRISANGLKEATLGDSSQVKVGTQVLAIGNALGQFQNSVTEGIISGKGRPVAAGDELGGQVEQLQDLLQTDAAINPGNSGGPLVDLTGNVVGINTAVAASAQGIGFAIPINLAKSELNNFKVHGKIIKAYLGIRYIPLTREFASSNDLPTSNGAYVVGDQAAPGVISGSPADKAGIKEGDIITKVDNQLIDEDHTLSTVVNQHKVGDKVKLTFLRDNKEQTVEVTLDESPQ